MSEHLISLSKLFSELRQMSFARNSNVTISLKGHDAKQEAFQKVIHDMKSQFQNIKDGNQEDLTLKQDAFQLNKYFNFTFKLSTANCVEFYGIAINLFGISETFSLLLLINQQANSSTHSCPL
ncbi:CLUMA_CG010360, isoform A [Clunio marinus]|uniref:CLUMA_CG010360, isoform A n=1 Tax=Clunio marinus TaxID=568069 RepID=A0A1J1IEZ0_9DIPT|nr:CLUMA_CG010360, isoform A [Clunio marinus]